MDATNWVWRQPAHTSPSGRDCSKTWQAAYCGCLASRAPLLLMLRSMRPGRPRVVVDEQGRDGRQGDDFLSAPLLRQDLRAGTIAPPGREGALIATSPAASRPWRSTPMSRLALRADDRETAAPSACRRSTPTITVTSFHGAKNLSADQIKTSGPLDRGRRRGAGADYGGGSRRFGMASGKPDLVAVHPGLRASWPQGVVDYQRPFAVNPPD